MGRKCADLDLDLQERSRLTALGAGVEKIARHHKEEQLQSAGGAPAAEQA